MGEEVHCTWVDFKGESVTDPAGPRTGAEILSDHPGQAIASTLAIGQTHAIRMSL